VVRTVFKIAEAVVRRLVGSIPTRSRQNRYSTRNDSEQSALGPLQFARLASRFDDSIEQFCRAMEHGWRNVRVRIGGHSDG
jgi:hypothetical protein